MSYKFFVFRLLVLWTNIVLRSALWVNPTPNQPPLLLSVQVKTLVPTPNQPPLLLSVQVKTLVLIPEIDMVILINKQCFQFLSLKGKTTAWCSGSVQCQVTANSNIIYKPCQCYGIKVYHVCHTQPKTEVCTYTIRGGGCNGIQVCQT